MLILQAATEAGLALKPLVVIEEDLYVDIVLPDEFGIWRGSDSTEGATSRSDRSQVIYMHRD